MTSGDLENGDLWSWTGTQGIVVEKRVSDLIT